ncbi:MAG: aromatic aminobenezylarsenical efflux permease ArsG family transporter [Bryobacteraceae bacterium]|jgi:cytochrome c biogenesis protein CcdA
MEGFLLGVVSALWLGILTAISSCALATSVAAMAFIAKELGSPKRVLLIGTLYTVGCAVASAALAALLSARAFALADASFFLETYVNKALGPILFVVGILLLDVVPASASASGVTARIAVRPVTSGWLGAGLLGMLFALPLCPASEALFFGSLVPFAASHDSTVVLPSFFGIGSGLPVFAFALLIALGAQRVGQALNRLARFEKWARRIAAVVFIVVGIGFCLKYIFDVQV